MTTEEIAAAVRARSESEHVGRRIRARVQLTDADDGTVVEVIEVAPPSRPQVS